MKNEELEIKLSKLTIDDILSSDTKYTSFGTLSVKNINNLGDTVLVTRDYVTFDEDLSEMYMLKSKQ